MVSERDETTARMLIAIHIGEIQNRGSDEKFHCHILSIKRKFLWLTFLCCHGSDGGAGWVDCIHPINVPKQYTCDVLSILISCRICQRTRQEAI